MLSVNMLSDVMLSVNMLSVIMQSDVMLSVITLSDIINSVIMLTVLHTVCRYSESHYADSCWTSELLHIKLTKPL